MADNTPAPAADTPAPAIAPDTPAPAAAPESKPAPSDRRGVIREALAKGKEAGGDADGAAALRDAGRPPSQRGIYAKQGPRDEAGRLQPKPQGAAAPKPATHLPAKPAAAPVAQPGAAPAPYPHDWKPEHKAFWEKLDPQFAAYIAQRNKEHAEGVKPLLEKSRAYEELNKVVAPFEAAIRAEGGTIATATAQMLQTAQLLRTGTPAAKAQLVAQTMRQFGVPMEHVAAMLGGAQAPQGTPAGLDPTAQALWQKVTSLEQTLQQKEQASAQADESARMREAESFYSDPKFPHANALTEKMIGLIGSGLINRDGKTYRAVMEEAYTMALRLDPELFAQSQAATNAAADAKRREEAARAATAARQASVQVRGAPALSELPGQPPNPSDRRAVIAAALRSGTG